MFRSFRPAAMSRNGLRLPRDRPKSKNPSSYFSSANRTQFVCKPYANLSALAAPRAPGRRQPRFLTNSSAKHCRSETHAVAQWRRGQVSNVSDS